MKPVQCGIDASPPPPSLPHVQEELDLTSTFVSKARLKVSSRAPLHKDRTEKGKAEKGKGLPPLERAEQQDVSGFRFWLKAPASPFPTHGACQLWFVQVGKGVEGSARLGMAGSLAAHPHPPDL